MLLLTVHYFYQGLPGIQQIICQHILRWVEENLDTGLGIDTLARATGYSRRTIELWFAGRFGMAPGEYLSRRRMTRAAVLLRVTSLPVTEIATLLCHSNNQNFARAFRRFSGKSPTEYRGSEVWDLSVLQSSLYYPVESDVEVGVCTLPARYLCGEAYFYRGTWLQEGDAALTDSIRQEVIRRVRSDASNICMVGRTLTVGSLRYNRDGLVGSQVVLGEVTHMASEDAVFLPEGKYCHYRFSCLWDDYCFTSGRLFMKVMSEAKLRLRNEGCCVYFSGNRNDISERVTCEFFIPVC